MGIPELKIAFKEVRRKAIDGTAVGVVLLLLKETSLSGLKEYEDIEAVKPDEYKKENLKYIEQAFIGNVQYERVGTILEERAYQPSKVYVYSISSKNTLDKALEEIESLEFNYVCMPEAVAEDNMKITAFVDRLSKEVGYEASAIVVSESPNNKSNVIEFASDNIVDGDNTYKATDMLPFIAGACAGTPMTQSVTYCVVPFLSNIPKKTNQEVSTLVDAGKVTLLKKAGAIRIARGVTSLTAPVGNEGPSFKKIKLVRTYQFINNSIKRVISNHYVGKVSNTYDNKCLLISEIDNFLNELSRDGVIDRDYTVEIDVQANKAYMKEAAIDFSGYSEQQLKEANTGSKVFLAIKLKGVDAMEDFYIKVNV